LQLSAAIASQRVSKDPAALPKDVCAAAAAAVCAIAAAAASAAAAVDITQLSSWALLLPHLLHVWAHFYGVV
jgi:hypothetical protein